MGYRIALDELNEEDLLREILERAESRSKGLCDYCKRAPTQASCRFPERHRPAPELAKLGKLAGNGDLEAAKKLLAVLEADHRDAEERSGVKPDRSPGDLS